MVIKLAWYHSTYNIDFSRDLIQEGYMALMNSYKSYWSKKNVYKRKKASFTTYAYTAIQRKMREYANAYKLSITRPTDIFQPSTPKTSKQAELMTVGGLDGTHYHSLRHKDDPTQFLDVNKVNSLLVKLDKRERYIIENYYGLNGIVAKNLIELSKEYKMSHERVRQLLNRAYFKMKRAIRTPTSVPHIDS